MPEDSAPSPYRRPAVLADVAQAAGVSTQTVSRVLNDQRWVAESTRQRVMQAVEAVDYRPNRAARTLATNRSRNLGVVGLDITLFGSTSPLLGFERAARAEGYGVSIASVITMDEPSMREAIGLLTELPVDGVAIIAPETEAASGLQHLPRNLPVVAVEAEERTGLATVGLDQAAASRSAVQHLIDLGHRRIGHLAGAKGRLEASGRQAGWHAALEAAGLRCPQPWVGDWTSASGYAAGQEFLRTRAVTAVFVANDLMALGFMRAVQDAGVRIPDDLSVVGFDDIQQAAYFSPPLTSVRQDFDAVGKACLELLLQRLATHNKAPKRQVVPTSLVIRASSAPPR